MRAVLTAAEQRAADAAAMQTVSHAVLVERAGLAAAIGATRLLPLVYGARVTVICGPGSNGADGAVAARHLQDRGAQVTVLDAVAVPARIERCDAVVDAAFGTGLSRPWDAPVVDPSVPVLAVDIVSGVDPDTGLVAGRALGATVTVAMGSLKRGHLLAAGAALCGELAVAPIGIEPTEASCALVEDEDLDALAPLARDEHKWRRALAVVGGQPTMPGAPGLVCDGAIAAQAGMVLCCVPGATSVVGLPREVVRIEAGEDETADAVLAELGRVHALVVGPGLGRGPAAKQTVSALVAKAPIPVVLDADALHLVDPASLRTRAGDAALGAVVLTPHDGEYEALIGERPGTDRFESAARLAEATGCTVLLKGPTTAVARGGAGRDDGLPLLAVTAGTPDLATPGTGDVLAGVVGALLARGTDAHLAAALAAHVHGRAGAALGARCRAGALPGAIAAVLEHRRDGATW